MAYRFTFVEYDYLKVSTLSQKTIAWTLADRLPSGITVTSVVSAKLYSIAVVSGVRTRTLINGSLNTALVSPVVAVVVPLGGITAADTEYEVEVVAGLSNSDQEPAIFVLYAIS